MTLTDALHILAHTARDRHHDRALALITTELHRQAGGRTDHADAAQTVTLRIWAGGAAGYRGDTDAAARSYLAMALRNACRDQHRAADREPPPAPPSADPPSADPPTNLNQHVRAALAALLRADVPRALASRTRVDHRAHLIRGLKLRARQLRAALLGGRKPRLSEADERLSRRAAAVLRRTYRTDDADPIAACIARLAAVDLRALTH